MGKTKCHSYLFRVRHVLFLNIPEEMQLGQSPKITDGSNPKPSCLIIQIDKCNCVNISCLRYLFSVHLAGISLSSFSTSRSFGLSLPENHRSINRTIIIAHQSIHLIDINLFETRAWRISMISPSAVWLRRYPTMPYKRNYRREPYSFFVFLIILHSRLEPK